jgi:flagellar basal-body rod protein FlgB
MLEKLTSNLTLREKALDAAWTRNEVIAQNIANVDTPNYKKKTVRFEEYLEDALDKDGFKGNTTDKRHIQIGSASADQAKVKITTEYSNLSTRLDGNNVDIESEMASLAKNDIRYNAITQSISGSFTRLRSVIREGK